MALPALGRTRLGGHPRVASIALPALAAAVVGIAYAYSAYAAGPLALPILIAAVGAFAVGLLRLEWGLALLVFLTPFSENAQISNPGAAKLRLALVLWAFLLTVVRLGALIRSGQRLRVPAMGAAAAGFLAAGVASVLAAEQTGAAASKFLLLCGSVTIFVLASTSLLEWRQVEIVLGGAVAAGLAVCLHAIYQQLSGHLSDIGFVDVSGTVEYRVTSVFSHPNQLAGFLVVLVPIALVLTRHFSRLALRLAAGMLVVLALAVVALTYSRGALVGLLALPLLTVRNPRSWPVIAGVLVVIALLAPGGWHERIAGAGSLKTAEIATRVELWQAAEEAFRERPVAGWGLNNFPTAYLSLERPGRGFLGNGRFDVPPTAHNLYLNVAAEEGVFGLAALLALAIAFLRMVGTLRKAADPRRRAMGTALLGMGLVLALHNLFDVTFLDPKTSTLVWMLFGIGAALTRGPAADDAHRR